MPPLELPILKIIARSPNHGGGITLHIQEASAGLLSIEEGSLYPALHRLERDGFLSSEWSVTASARKAKFYKLTASGRKRLAAAEQAWPGAAAHDDRNQSKAGPHCRSPAAEL